MARKEDVKSTAIVAKGSAERMMVRLVGRETRLATAFDFLPFVQPSSPTRTNEAAMNDYEKQRLENIAYAQLSLYLNVLRAGTVGLN
jgi:hypothetical protein